MVREKNVIITIAAVLLVILLAFGVYSMFQPAEENNTTEEVINLTVNETNESVDNSTNISATTNSNTNIASKATTKKSTSTSKEKSSDNGVYYDEELNEYFDSNGKTVRDAQYPKGTSREQMKKDLDSLKNDFD